MGSIIPSVRLAAVAGAVVLVSWQLSAASEQKMAQALVQPAPAAPEKSALPAAPLVLSGELMAHSCAACHGTQGRLGDESFVPLAGMPESQFIRAMTEFRSDKRPSTLMGHVAKGFGDAELEAMARYFSAVMPLPEGAQP